MSGPKVLVLQHVSWEGLGLLHDFLEQETIASHIIHLYDGDDLPTTELLQGSYLAVIGLGSPATSYIPETNPRHTEEVELFRLIRKVGIPSFMICYSMQLFCIAHGGKVVPNPNGKEVGFFDTYLTPAGEGDKVIGPLGTYRTLQWHQVAVMDGMHYLVQGDGQAADASILRVWFEKDRAWACAESGASEPHILEEAERNQGYYRHTYRRLFGNFVSVAREITERNQIKKETRTVQPSSRATLQPQTAPSSCL